MVILSASMSCQRQQELENSRSKLLSFPSRPPEVRAETSGVRDAPPPIRPRLHAASAPRAAGTRQLSARHVGCRVIPTPVVLAQLASHWPRGPRAVVLRLGCAPGPSGACGQKVRAAGRQAQARALPPLSPGVVTRHQRVSATQGPELGYLPIPFNAVCCYHCSLILAVTVLRLSLCLFIPSLCQRCVCVGGKL